MKIQEIIYFLDQTKFCLTVIKSLIKRWLRHVKFKSLNASTYNNDKKGPLQKKAVEEKNCIYCIGCINYDWWNGECIYAGEIWVSHDPEAITQDYMMADGSTTSRD